MCKRSERVAARNGFTLVELLVVIAIIAILIGLLLPAVQKVRDAAQRTGCQNNQKQIGLAMNSYHDANQVLPSGGIYTFPPPGNPTNGYPLMGWGVAILPYVEQGNLYSQYNAAAYNWDPSNTNVLTTPVTIFNCPADPYAGRVLSFAQGNYTQAASSSYRGVAGVDTGLSFWDYPTYINAGFAPLTTRGALSTTGYPYNYSQILSPVRITDITDGSSNTFLVGEYVDISPDNLLFRCYWAVNYVFYELGGVNANDLLPPQIDSYDNCTQSETIQICRRGFGSTHGFGMHFVMADGHVVWIDKSIAGNVYQALATIQGGEVIGAF